MPTCVPSLRRLARPLVPFILAALVLGAPSPVVADHGGREIQSFLPCDRPVTPPRCTSVANNLYHFVAFDPSLTTELAESMRRSMADAFDAPTKLVMVEQERRVASTDVVAFSGDYGENGAAGWVYCPTDAPQGINPSGHRWCRHQELHLNLNPRYGLFFDDDASRDYVTCHELGHTVGLLHWGNPPETDGPVAATCMNADTPNGPTSLDQADIDHINAYPYEMRRLTPPPAPRDPVDGPLPLRLLPPRPGGPTFLGAPAGPIALLEPDEPHTLHELVAASDAVVRARVVSVERGRVFGPPTRPFHYAAVTVEVLELLGGTLPAGHRHTLVLEIPLFDGLDSIDVLRDAAPTGERILFLRNKGETARAAGLGDEAVAADAGYYRLTTHAAEVVAVRGRATVGGGDTSPLGLLRDTSFAEALHLVRRVAGSPSRY